MMLGEIALRQAFFLPATMNRIPSFSRKAGPGLSGNEGTAFVDAFVVAEEAGIAGDGY